MQLGSLLYISNSISSHSTHTVGTASDWDTRGQKLMDKVLSMCLHAVLVCPGSAGYYFLDRVQELCHQSDRVVPILVANMLMCL